MKQALIKIDYVNIKLILKKNGKKLKNYKKRAKEGCMCRQRAKAILSKKHLVFNFLL